MPDMRFRLTRVLFACSVLTCTALFYFFAAPRFPSFIDVTHLPTPTLTPTSYKLNGTAGHKEPFVFEARRFWQLWTKALLVAKPQVGPVVVKSRAGNVGLGTILGFREKPVSRITLSADSLASLKLSHSLLRGQLDAYDGKEDFYTGAGVVTVAGGEYFGPAIVGIKMLRLTGSTLPVEVFLAHPGEYEAEICEHVLRKLGARCVILTDFTDSYDGDKETRFNVTHFQLKSLALLFSTFNDVLYLDSDSIPLLDPSELFDAEPYTSTGLVGWPDFWVGSEAPEFYKIAGMAEFPTNLPRASSEAGQLLMDKSRHLKTLLLAVYYNIWGPDWFYPLLSQGALGQGDKNTFETAAVVLGAPYYRVKMPVKSIGRHSGGMFRGSGMVQFHPGMDFQVSTRNKGAVDEKKRETLVKPAFIHANTPKMNAGHLVDEGDLKEPDSGKSLRLWGSVEEQKSLFGTDVEKKAFKFVVETGCELDKVLKEWKSRSNVCERLESHFKETFK